VLAEMSVIRDHLNMKTALIAFVRLGIAAGLGPSARAGCDDQHHHGIIITTPSK
jgi:hypothetical protein